DGECDGVRVAGKVDRAGYAGVVNQRAGRVLGRQRGRVGRRADVHLVGGGERQPGVAGRVRKGTGRDARRQRALAGNPADRKPGRRVPVDRRDAGHGGPGHAAESQVGRLQRRGIERLVAIDVVRERAGGGEGAAGEGGGGGRRGGGRRGKEDAGGEGGRGEGLFSPEAPPPADGHALRALDRHRTDVEVEGDRVAGAVEGEGIRL